MMGLCYNGDNKKRQYKIQTLDVIYLKKQTFVVRHNKKADIQKDKVIIIAIE